LGLRAPATQPTDPQFGLVIYTFAPTPHTTVETSRAAMAKYSHIVRDEAVDIGGVPGRMFVTEHPFTPMVKDAHGQMVDGTPTVMSSMQFYVFRRPWAFSISGRARKDRFDHLLREAWQVLNTLTYGDAPAAAIGTTFRDVKHGLEYRVPTGWEFDKAHSGESNRIYTRAPDAKPPMRMDQLEVIVATEKASDLDAVLKAVVDEVRPKSAGNEVHVEPATLGSQPAQRISYDSVDADQKITTTRIIALKAGQRCEIQLTCDAQRAAVCAGALKRMAESFKL
jgi:hypothetical protein